MSYLISCILFLYDCSVLVKCLKLVATKFTSILDNFLWKLKYLWPESLMIEMIYYINLFYSVKHVFESSARADPRNLLVQTD